MALRATGLAILLQIAATILLRRHLRAPWDTGVPMSLGLAAFFTYHPLWRRPEWRRATALHFAAVTALGLLVAGVMDRLGWWR